MNLPELNDLKATIGSTVTVRDLKSGDVETYTLVPPALADIKTNRISTVTPVAHAVYGRRAGEEVDVVAPGGTIRLIIESVRPETEDNEYG